jgi:hypothetical protein
MVLRVTHPSRHRHSARSDGIADLRQGQTNLGRLDHELEPTFRRLPDQDFCVSKFVEKLSGPRFVGDELSRGASTPGGQWRRHDALPTVWTGVGTALARRVGTWNDPTRVSLGQGMHGVSLRSMVCDLPVAHSAVNGDRCSPCSLAIVLSTLRSPTGPTVECSQCCHFSTYTRRNRQDPVSEPLMPSRRAPAQPGAKADRRTAPLISTRTEADAENSRGEH